MAFLSFFKYWQKVCFAGLPLVSETSIYDVPNSPDIYLMLQIRFEIMYNHFKGSNLKKTSTKVLLEKGWYSKRMIAEGDAAIPLETTRRAFGNQEKSKQRSAINKKWVL